MNVLSVSVLMKCSAFNFKSSSIIKLFPQFKNLELLILYYYLKSPFKITLIDCFYIQENQHYQDLYLLYNGELSFIFLFSY